MSQELSLILMRFNVKTENRSLDNQGMDMEAIGAGRMCASFFDLDPNELAGALCMHVDDVLLGGHGAAHPILSKCVAGKISIPKMEKKHRIILRFAHARCHHKKRSQCDRVQMLLRCQTLQWEPEEKATAF